MRLLFALLFVWLAFPLSAQVVINEYSCANVSGFTDNYGEREDWVEFYNPTGAAIDLAGYHMSDRLNNPTKWTFPAGSTVPANGFLRVICSGRNEVSGGNIHTGFKLTQTKPEILVFAAPGGSVLESFPLNPTLSDHSRGRTPDGGTTWTLYQTPTPGAANGTPSPEYSARPQMNMPAGAYSGTISVSITTADASATLRYTLDGSEPTAASPVVSGPISISTTTVLRARGFSSTPGVPPSFIESNTFLINVNHSIPILSVFGTDVGDLFNGSQIEPGCDMEWFTADGQFVTEANGDANKHGNDSWAYSQRGIDFIARDQFGYSYAMRSPLFSRKGRDEFQRLIIKCGANDNYPFEDGAYIRDAYLHTLSHDGDLHMDERTYEPCVLYMNGQYWGLYEIREKVDDHDFTSHYYDQDEFNLQFLKTWGATWSEYGGPQAQADWDALRAFIMGNDMSIQANWDYVDSLYNWKSLCDYFILNSYAVCMDWLNWNTAWWRGMDPNGDKKKWRYILWDLDASFGHYINYTGIPDTGPTADPCDPEDLPDPGGQGHTDILNKLMENPVFDAWYVNRWIELTNTTFSCANMISKLDSLINRIAPEMPAQIARWGGSMTQWQNQVQELRDFINTRCAYIDDGLVDCYDLTGPYTVTINVDPPGGGMVYLNDYLIPSYPYTTTLYGGITNQLTAVPSTNFVFVNWTANTNTPNPNTTDSIITMDFVANDEVTAHFKTPVAVFVPTGFSPNGDGLNDVLQIMGEGIVSLNFAIYDRWGQRVFQTTDVNVSWDGTFNGQPLNSGVFAYKVYAVLADGEEINQSGNITLMR